VSHEPPDADAFRVAYRELLEAFARLAPSALTGAPSWAEALFVDPLRFPAELDQSELAVAKQRFLVIVSGVVPSDRDVYREIARSELRTMFGLHAPETQMAPPRAARRSPPPPHAPSRPPPPKASGGLGGKLKSVFSALRRKPTAPQHAPASGQADDDGGSWQYEAAPTPIVRPPSVPPPAPPPAPRPPPIDVAREASAPSAGAEPSDEWVSRDITGGAGQVDERTAVRHTARAKPPARDDAGGRPGAEEPSAENQPETEAAEPVQPPEARYLNAAIAGRAADAPLEVEKPYVLEVSVDLQKTADGVALQIPDTDVLFEEDEQVITLTIQVTGDDFEIAQDHQELKLPRRGPSKGKARFDITPKHEGRCTLTVGVHKEGNFVMCLVITYSVGVKDAAPESVAVLGRPISAASNL
jgi:hypothetical protein